MSHHRLALACCLLLATVAHAQSSAPGNPVERGRHLIKIAGCNDCHTAGYGPSGGQTPEKDWLQGDELGWQGPWGTTYATNLRLHFSQRSEKQWLHEARAMKTRPSMPWFVFREMSDSDLRAIYAYMRKAGPAGRPVPGYVPPGQAAPGPVVRFPG
jgi:mono/diheme cytochrome c family protein